MSLDAARQFSSAIFNISPLGNGHINDTYLVETAGQPFVLQKINKHVFPHPEQIMANLTLLNQHFRGLNEIKAVLKLPEHIAMENGSAFFQDEQGDYWRALGFIENTESLETIANVSQAEQVGFALGQFHRLTQTLGTERFHDTLPGFHVCPNYLAHYQGIERVTTLPENAYCTDFIARYHTIAHDLEAAKHRGLLAMRVIHGDPKLNNFLFDKESQRVVSLIDLDTVKPGLLHYDIGDCIRSCCHDLATDQFDLNCCKALLTSYLREMGGYFTAHDYEFLYPAIRLIPFELGLRFYTDYLEGNRYFKVQDETENVFRAIAQFRLCANIIDQEVEIKKLIKILC